MPRVKDYQILSYTNAKDLREAVERHMGNGWQPFGGVSVAVIVDDEKAAGAWAQAMVKYED